MRTSALLALLLAALPACATGTLRSEFAPGKDPAAFAAEELPALGPIEVLAATPVADADGSDASPYLERFRDVCASTLAAGGLELGEGPAVLEIRFAARPRERTTYSSAGMTRTRVGSSGRVVSVGVGRGRYKVVDVFYDLELALRRRPDDPLPLWSGAVSMKSDYWNGYGDVAARELMRHLLEGVEQPLRDVTWRK